MKKSKEERLLVLQKEKEKQEQYENEQKLVRDNIKKEKHHFFKLLWFYFKKPFVWLFRNIKDWRTAIIFIIVFLVVSCEVWIPYLLAILSWGTTFSKTMIGVGSACWSFWLLPGTPFILICISLTMLIKGIFNKIRFKKIK